MTPTSPVLPGSALPEVVFAKDQRPYKPLPACRVDDTTLLTRWRMSWKERLLALVTGDVYLWISKDIYTPLQPVALSVEKPV